MGTIRNSVHAVLIVAGMLAMAVFFKSIGIEMFLDSTFSRIGIVVSLILAFFEVTYSRM
ncbi:MAG: hypothetical protein QT03_C0001G0804 [archaeon GW2011_AR10]|uniref:Uncharacterized protein n=1 Tax=Candidatus Iainarchaeum sp. TaxID=3101447 RepID=A0A7J4IT25_9ARCH|nr:MAG: hypothetical protein QT03_C0001G0804 [archaeon GW2011_AR10]HIH08668.1 hypothetical protein [Candidatus Diapherotrites archaeon]